jgi:predicted GTPase
LRPAGLFVDVAADDLTISTNKGLLQIFDMPGIGDDMATFEAYREIYLQVMPLADVILWVHPAEDRMIAGVQQALAELVGAQMPQLTERLVFGLNKSDVIQPNDWNTFANVPSEQQLRHLGEREADFSQRIRHALPHWRGQAQAYSAERRYGLTSLFKRLMYAMPPERRWVLEDRMDLADFFELVDRNILKHARKLAKVPHDRTEQHDVVASSDPVAYLQGLTDQEYANLVRDRESLMRILREA